MSSSDLLFLFSTLLQISQLKSLNSEASFSSWIHLLDRSPLVLPLPSRRVVYVLNFKGDILASQVEFFLLLAYPKNILSPEQVSKLRKEITAVLQSADINRGDEVVVVLNSSGGAVNSYGLAAAQLERIKVS